MAKLFGTDGIRGVAGERPLDAPTIASVGAALAAMGGRLVLIGRDTRSSGPWVEAILRDALSFHGVQATLAGATTTPGVSFLTRRGGFDRGVMISASHNPFQDNGVKIFGPDGMKLSDAEERRIEQFVGSRDASPSPLGLYEAPTEEIRRADPVLRESYVEFLSESPLNGGLQGVKVVLDCANGGAFSIAPEVFRRLGAEVVAMCDAPDGRNINESCGALHPEAMARAVVSSGAAFGVAFDGDADRAILADEKGGLVDGDFVLFVLGRHFKRRGALPSGVVVTTVMANLGLEVALKREGVDIVRTKVGDRHVLEEMIRGGHELGGEQSGHTIILKKSPSGDGILSALQMAEIMVAEGRPLSEICAGMVKFPQVLVNVTVKQKPDFSAVPEIRREIEAAHAALDGRGRVVIRYSGTEPKVRVMVEGDRKEEIEAWAEAIAGSFRRALG